MTFEPDDSQVILIPSDRIRPFQGQPRTHFDKDKLRALAASMKKNGQKVAVVVQPTNPPSSFCELVDGERRWIAADMVGIKELKGIVVPWQSFEERFEESAVFNFCRESHTKLETMRALLRIRKNKGYTYDELGERFGMSRGSVYLYLQLENLNPEVIEKYLEDYVPEENKLSLMVAVDLSKFHPSKQEAHAFHIVSNKMTGIQARMYLERAASKSGDQIRNADWTDRKQWQRIRGFLTVALNRVDSLLSIEVKDLKTTLSSRSETDLKMMVEDIQDNIERLKSLQDLVKEVNGNRLKALK